MRIYVLDYLTDVTLRLRCLTNQDLLLLSITNIIMEIQNLEISRLPFKKIIQIGNEPFKGC